MIMFLGDDWVRNRRSVLPLLRLDLTDVHLFMHMNFADYPGSSKAETAASQTGCQHVDEKEMVCVIFEVLFFSPCFFISLPHSLPPSFSLSLSLCFCLSFSLHLLSFFFLSVSLLCRLKFTRKLVFLNLLLYSIFVTFFTILVATVSPYERCPEFRDLDHPDKVWIETFNKLNIL